MKISYLFSKAFWAKVSERATKTFAQTLAALLVGNTANAVSVDWNGSLAVAGAAALASVLTSFASGKVGPEEDPSLV